ncbi:zygote arrest protein 1 [Perognathus longimembris pacificus]|uniref:zygote arrest protein 1 n=1 Tax=Perognathus longimembris pacificus TaxID=214514 RepID=UPI0020198060|nr:zygote arrest protein 1 [Perognathus longimembris pacificus]
MAALGAEVLGATMYPACAPCAHPVPGPLAARGKAAAAADGRCLRTGGSSTSAAAAPSFPGSAQPTAADSLDGYQRAQLLALLSRVSAGVGRGSREVAVQVNPRRDAAVQCSLGRRPLPRRPRDPGAPASPQPARRGPEPGSLVGGGPRLARFPRTVAVFSPVPHRLTAFLEAERRPPFACPGAREGEGEGAERKTPRLPQAEKNGEEAAALARGAPQETPVDGSGTPAESGEDAAAPKPAPQRQQLRPAAAAAAARDEDRGVSAEGPAELEHSSTWSAELGAQRLPLQFLEQKYGYYHCKDCNIRWESAYVWCVQGTSKVYFKQFCRTCQKSYNPYRVEDITCQSCRRTRCSCPVRLRHVDPKRPHRQDLCGRCKGKRLSCDSTFSFKYII